MDSNTYALPPEMNSIISATIVQTSLADVIICHDQYFIYAAKVNKNPTVFTFQKFAQASISAVVPIIKNYFMALSNLKKIMIFQVSFTEEGKILLKYNYNKQKSYSSYFIRQVVQNMAELQIFYPENEILIFQFTVNGKVGTMTYSITPQHKLKTCERQQLYGSKTIFSANRKMIYYFTNFSSKSVSYHNLSKFQNEIFDQLKIAPMAYVCLPKIQEFYILSTNFTAIHVPNYSNRHKIYCENNQHYDYIQRLIQQIDNRDDGLTISTYMDLIMIQDIQRQIAYTFQLKQKNSALIGVEHGTMNWFWTCSRKLIGLSPNRSQFKIIQSLKINEALKAVGDTIQPVRKDYKLNINQPPKHNQFLSHKQFYQQKMKENQQLHKIEIKKLQAMNSNQTGQNKDKPIPQNKWPVNIIQRNKTSTSKTLHKSKQIEPIASNSTPTNPLNIAANLKLQDVRQTKTTEQKFEVVSQDFKKQLDEQKRNTVQFTSSSLQYCSVIEDKQQDDLLKQSNNVIDKNSQDDVSNPHKSKQSNKVIQQLIQKQILGLIQQQDNKINPFALSQNPQPMESIKPKEVDKKQDSQETTQNKVEIHNKDKKEEDNDQKDNEKGQQNLPRSLAVLVAKSQLGGQYSHTINLFNTSINRNNIFTSIYNQTPNLFLKKNHSQGDYYNPLLCYSPCSPDKKQQSKNQSLGQKVQQKKIQSQSQKSQKAKESLLQLNVIREKQNFVIIEKVKELFHQSTNKILKQLEQLGKINEIQPYIRDHVIDEIKMKVYDNLQRQMMGDFSSRIQKYFIEVFRQTSEVQEQSVKFYKEANNYKSKNLQIQINNQQKILKDIREIESNLRMHVVNLKRQSKQSFQNLMRDWQNHFKDSSKMVDNLNGIKIKLQEQTDIRVQKEKEVKAKLIEIKKYLLNRINAKQQRQQKRMQKRGNKKVVDNKVQKSRDLQLKSKTKGFEDSKLKSKNRQNQC